jgi:hypothetical protein
MASSETSTAAWPPGTRTHRLSAKPTFCSASWGREGMSSGRIPASSVRSATRAARLADRTDTNVARASTRVPTAVAIEAAVAQSMGPILARPPEPGRPGAVRTVPAFDIRWIPVNERRLGGAPGQAGRTGR